MIEFSKTDDGQFYFHLFKALGMTPNQWRSLDPRDSVFLASAFNEMNRRESEELRQHEQAQRARSGLRR